MARFALLPAPAIGFLAVVAFAAVAAHAETAPVGIPLRSGLVLEAREVRVLEGRLNVRIVHEGVLVRVDVPFDRVEPRALLGVLDARRDPSDAAALLGTARVAFALHLPEQAARRWREAAALDPALAAARDAGHAAIARRETGAVRVALEAALRGEGDPAGALARAETFLAGPWAGATGGADRRRVEVLVRLAGRRLGESPGVPAVATPGPTAAGETDPPLVDAPALQAGAGAAPVGAGVGAADDVLPPVLASAIAALEAKARHARDAAADPAVGRRKAIRLLETAAEALMRGRRLVREAPPAVQDALVEAGASMEGALVAAWLELADLYRIERAYEAARARVRAVLLLDPDNEPAWAQRHLIEEDLRRPGPWDDDPYGGPVLFESYVVHGAWWHGISPWHGYGTWSGPGFGAYGHARGGRRVIGWRR